VDDSADIVRIFMQFAVLNPNGTDRHVSPHP
jgi:hypothetical protein